MKILIRATNWVGDAIMALPALRAVRTRFPDAEITILARPYVAAIYKNQQVCDNMMFVDDKNDIVGELRAQKFDLALLASERLSGSLDCLASGNSRAHRLCARWPQPSTDESLARSQARRNSRT